MSVFEVQQMLDLRMKDGNAHCKFLLSPCETEVSSCMTSCPANCLD